MDRYLHGMQGKRVAVIGIGISNTPLIRLLRQAGISVTACDKSGRESFGPLADELENLGVELRLGPGYLEGLDQEVIFRTPGMHPDTPALAQAKARGSVVTSEMEAFFQVCPCPIIAVTGSDGKTTTTTIISQLMERAGHRVFVGGNIGHPLLAEVPGMVKEDWAVLELSSFQLMTMDRSPRIAVVTNLAPNHLDIHKSMEEYVAAKENIFLYQSPEDKVVLNFDNNITRDFAGKAPGRVMFFSRQGGDTSGVYLRDGIIRVNGARGDHAVLDTADILLPGAHNVENYMAAIAAVEGLVPDQVIRDYARTFAGVEHRIELVRTLDGVRYYNDSIASSPTRTMAGLRSFREKVILIAGGYDKHIPYEPLGPDLVAHVKLLILTGATAPKIRAAAEGAPGYDPQALPILETEDLAAAVAEARRQAQPGDVVILSPASASFDRYKNFMERGQAFKDLVNGLEG